MLPLTPGTTMVAAAMTPTPNSFSTFARLRATLASAPVVSPIRAMPTTRAKKAAKHASLPALALWPFTL